MARRQVSLRTRPRREENPKNHHEEGMATVETALSLCGVVFVALALIVAVSVAGLHGEVCQVARDAARLTFLGHGRHGPNSCDPGGRCVQLVTRAHG